MKSSSLESRDEKMAIKGVLSKKIEPKMTVAAVIFSAVFGSGVKVLIH